MVVPCDAWAERFADPADNCLFTADIDDSSRTVSHTRIGSGICSRNINFS